MKRLRDEEAAPGSVERAAIDLLSAARPYEPSPLARARVRRALSREPAARGAWLFRAAVVALLLVVGSVAARATLGERWRAWRRSTPVAAPVTLAPRAPIAPAVSEPMAPVAPEPVVAPAPAPEVRARPARHVASVEAPAPVAATDDPALVATALRALRREHDPARAGALVEDYLRTWPKGALTEEAMALAVEAAVARHDARSAEWARRYLHRFPSGRFRDVVAPAAAPATP